MRARSRSQAPLVVGIAASVAFHLGVLVPTLFAVMTDQRASAPELESNFDEDALTPPPPMDDVQLGKADSTRSTLVWLGYDEYKEHLAALADVEQAAFDERPFGGLPAVPAPAAPQPSEQQPTDAPLAEQPTELALAEPLEQRSEITPELDAAPLDIAHDTPSEQPTVAAELDAADAQPTPAPADEIISPEAPPGVNAAPNPQGDGAMLDALSRFLEDMLSKAQEQAEELAASRTAGKSEGHAAPTIDNASASAAKPRKSAAKEHDEAQPRSAPSSPAAAGASATKPLQPGEQQNADQADMESDATSRTEVTLTDLNVGKPLVAQGLELKPRKPVFTNLVRMTALPGNPLCEIRFQKSGKPALARLLTSSGDARVDDALLASLYRWRAAGDPLAELEHDDDTIAVRIRIILSAR